MSRLIAAVLLLLCLPVFGILTLLLICLQGPPVLFRQRRCGLGGATFDIIKFRSMTLSRDDDGNLLSDAERKERFGSLLRRYRVDELPELINIVRGEMAFVGPRPLLPETVAAMGPEGQLRSSVRPGLTGWAQVNGNALLDERRKLDLDIWYIQHRSLALDLKIIARTPSVLLLGERIGDKVQSERSMTSPHGRGQLR